METNYAPAGLADDRVEFFVMNGEVQFIQGDKIHLFSEITIELATRLRQEIDSDQKIIKGLEILGITDPIEQLKQFAFCRYGELDIMPDIIFDGESTPEYWNCGKRPCPADGLICKLPEVKNGKLTRNDAELVRIISKDYPNKIIAELRNKSVHTINRQCTNLQHKIGCFSSKGIASFAGRNNLL